MMEGYKDSPLGKIPSDWVIEKLESLVVIESGVSPSQYEFHENGKNMFYKVNQLNDFEKKMGESPYRFESNLRNNIPANSIAFPKRGASIFTNKVRILSYPAMVDTNIMCLIPKKEINYEFLYYFILDFGLSKIADTSSIPQINNKHIYPIKIALPPLPEQQKIAEILSTVDAKIKVIDQQITETQALKKGLMQQLLTGKLSVIEKRLLSPAEMKDSPLGEIPKSWEVVELVNHIKLLSGFAFKSDGFNEEGKGIKLLRGINITIGKLRWNDKLDRWWDLPFDEVEKYSAQVGDLVISMDGSLVGRNYARVKLEDLPLLIVQRVACLRAKSTLDMEYLNQIIGGPLWLNYVDAVKTSSGIPHISAKNIREFKIPLPTLTEQKQISEILATISEKLDVLSEKKTHYQELKQGLMQQLLTGKIRVNNLIAQI